MAGDRGAPFTGYQGKLSVGKIHKEGIDELYGQYNL